MKTSFWGTGRLAVLVLGGALVGAVGCKSNGSGGAGGEGPGGAESGGSESGGSESGGSESGGSESGGSESGGSESGGAEAGGSESGGAEAGGSESGGAEAGGSESGGAESGGAEAGGSESGGAASGGAGSGGSGCTEDLDDDTACLDFDGEVVTFPAGAAIIGAGSADGQLSITFSQDGINMPPSLTINYAIDTEAGTVECETAPTAIGFTNEDGDFYSASSSGGSCSIELTATGPEVGDEVEGTFEAEVGDVLNGTSATVSGKFKTSVLF